VIKPLLCERIPAIHIPGVSPENALDQHARPADIGIMDGRDAFADEHLVQISRAVVLTALGHDGFWVGCSACKSLVHCGKNVLVLFSTDLMSVPSSVRSLTL
jgi:hypothetical protein